MLEVLPDQVVKEEEREPRVPPDPRENVAAKDYQGPPDLQARLVNQQNAKKILVIDVSWVRINCLQNYVNSLKYNDPPKVATLFLTKLTTIKDVRVPINPGSRDLLKVSSPPTPAPRQNMRPRFNSTFIFPINSQLNVTYSYLNYATKRCEMLILVKQLERTIASLDSNYYHFQRKH